MFFHLISHPLYMFCARCPSLHCHITTILRVCKWFATVSPSTPHSAHKSVPTTPNEVTTPHAKPHDHVNSTMAALHLSPRVENPNANRFLYHSNTTAAANLSSSSSVPHSSSDTTAAVCTPFVDLMFSLINWLIRYMVILCGCVLYRLIGLVISVMKIRHRCPALR